MKGIGALAAIVLAVMMVACGGSSSSTNKAVTIIRAGSKLLALKQIRVN
jgi:ABC-type molybdate transport system substrate-binding protein